MSSVCVKFTEIVISSCEIILILFSWVLDRVVQAYGMVGEGVLSVPTIGYGAVNLHATLGGTGVSTLSSDGSYTLRAGDVCTTLGCAPGLFRQARNRVSSSLRDTK